jgi:hypothetical protein
MNTIKTAHNLMSQHIDHWLSNGFFFAPGFIRKFGIDVTTELCEQLLTNGAPGLHFYTMNQSAASVAIWRNLGIDQRVNG